MPTGPITYGVKFFSVEFAKRRKGKRAVVVKTWEIENLFLSYRKALVLSALLGRVIPSNSQASLRAKKRTWNLATPPCIETRPVKQTPNLKRILRLPTDVIYRQYRLSTDTVARLRRELRVEPLGRWPKRSRRTAKLD